MTPKDAKTLHALEGIELDSFLDKSHSLYRLANSLNWAILEQALGTHYVEQVGRPGIPIRVIAGLHYLKYLFQESDEEVVEKFCENPYWQYFCGFKTFQHQLPCHPTSLVKWRKRIGEAGVEHLLKQTIDSAKREGFLSERTCHRVNVDTTVQEKAIAFPTDARLYHKMRIYLVREAKKRKVPLRQSYERTARTLFMKHARYRHARQMKRAKRALKKLKSYLGRVVRDLIRKVPKPKARLRDLLALAERVLQQKREDKNKLYSLHAPEVECIAKGKAKTKYEFGCKVAITTTACDPWVVSSFAVHANPYDGHTLKRSLTQCEQMTRVKVLAAFVDKGYRGTQHHPNSVQVLISETRGLPRTLKKLLRGRAGIEPVIGHLKADHHLGRNHLLGKIGDAINAVLAGCAFNLKKIIRFFTAQKKPHISEAPAM